MIDSTLRVCNDAKHINREQGDMVQSSQKRWKGPTIREVADLSGVGVATVDRVLNDRPGVREKTRERVNAALRKLADAQDARMNLNIRLLCDSGETFNQAMKRAAIEINRTLPRIKIEDDYSLTGDFDPVSFARKIEETGSDFDGLILIAREHPAVNQAVRRLVKFGTPVVCVTSDLPSARRSAYIGNDQYAAGSVAGQLIGHALPRSDQKILIVTSAAFRSQQEREMGFRRVLRSAYPHLRIEERVTADDVPETVFNELTRHFMTNGEPTAIYNVAGANRGVAQALEVSGIAETTIFVGHELTDVSRNLLESGTMDYVISHDVHAEIKRAANWIAQFRSGITDDPEPSSILVHTKYNCRY